MSSPTMPGSGVLFVMISVARSVAGGLVEVAQVGTRWRGWLAAVLLVPAGSQVSALTIDRSEYADRLEAFWAGQALANRTGRRSEGHRRVAPFYTDADWGTNRIRWAFRSPWQSDDDNDIEYIYHHLMLTHGTTMLSAAQIRDGWLEHVRSDGWALWVSNENAWTLMSTRAQVPPHTGLLQRSTGGKDFPLMIDAQLTTEFFGLYAPGMPAKALEMADLPISLTADSYAYQAAQFYVVMHALAPAVDPGWSMKEKMLWILRESRKAFPDTSRISDIFDFIEADYLANPDKDDWESTRDKVYERYQRDAVANGLVYRGWTESAINFACGVIAQFYGEGDYQRTVRIGTLAGWDSDNPTSTNGGLIGFLMGRDALGAEFTQSISDRYDIYATRRNFPDYLPNDPEATDTYTMLAVRMLETIDLSVAESGGTVDLVNDRWILPDPVPVSLATNNRWQLRTRSANITVVEEGGSVTATTDAGNDPAPIVDGFEHRFSGEEFDESAMPRYIGNAVSQATLTLDYSRDVEVHTIRLLQGGRNGAAAGRFTTLTWEARVGGAWVTLTGTAPAIEPGWTIQQIDFVLDTPVEADGIRVSGDVAGGSLGVFELDAFSAPLSERVRITTPGLPAGEAGAAYSVSLDAGTTQGPYSWTLLSGSLPPGLQLSSTGTIHGVIDAAAAGDYTATIEVTDSGTPATTHHRPFLLNVDGSPVITTAGLDQAFANRAFSQQLGVSGGDAPLTWKLVSGVLPPGLTLGASGVLAGTPRGVGRSPVSVCVTDDDGDAARRDFVIDVRVGEERSWTSHDVLVQAGMPPATVADSDGTVTAELQFYESADDGGVAMGTLLPTFRGGAHADASNELAGFWTGLTAGEDYPFAGKSSTPRGVGEVNVPMPLGVFDLTLHPPDNNHQIVAAFIAPMPGDYRISGLGCRLLSPTGDTTTLQVFLPDQTPLPGYTPLVATNSGAWVRDDSTRELGSQQAGAMIFTAVGKAGSFGGNATEVAWKISAEVPATQTSYGSWLAASFPDEVGDPAMESFVWGPQANPDHDLFANLVEYYFGLNPLVPDRNTGFGIFDDPNSGSPVFQFPANPEVGDLLVEVQELVGNQWVTFATNPPIVDGLVTIVLPLDRTSMLVRLRLTRLE